VTTTDTPTLPGARTAGIRPPAHYPDGMAKEESPEVAAARAAKDRLERARTELKDATTARDQAIIAAFLAEPYPGPAELARALGYSNDSTVRGLTRHFRDQQTALRDAHAEGEH